MFLLGNENRPLQAGLELVDNHGASPRFAVLECAVQDAGLRRGMRAMRTPTSYCR